jgi:hypothetical protein
LGRLMMIMGRARHRGIENGWDYSWLVAPRGRHEWGRGERTVGGWVAMHGVQSTKYGALIRFEFFLKIGIRQAAL